MTLQPGAETILYGALAAHLAVSVALVIISAIRSTERTKFLPILFGINAALVAISVFVGPVFLEFAEFIDVAAFVAYTIIGAYVVSIEIPGYILLSRFDDRLGGVLEEMRKKMVRLKYNFEIDPIESLCKSNANNLRSVGISDILDDFVKRCKTINNIDGTFYDIALKEIVDRGKSVSDRSKHPFPKLIEIFSLAGMSFLIGQFLTHFLP